MRGFEARDGMAVAGLDEEERAVIARIVADVGLLLGGEGFGSEAPSRDDAPAGGDRDGVEGMLAFLDTIDDSLVEPDDPALQRLLPNAAPTDRDVADEFRRLTHGDLTALKVERLRRLWRRLGEDGPELEIAPEDVLDVAATLTDVRLVLASRLSLESDEDATRLHEDIARAQAQLEARSDEPPVIDPERLWLGMLYDALTWLQESLVSLRLGGPHE